LENIDVFIPIIKKDLFILPSVISSLKKVAHNINNVYIVSPAEKEIINFCKENHVKFIFEEEILSIKKADINYRPNTIDRSGWLYQQLLKLSADIVCNSDYILLLDSDTVFLKKQVFINNNKIRLNYSKKEKHNPYIDFIYKIFPEFSIFPYSFVTHHFFLEKNVLSEIKNSIKYRTNLDWHLAIIDNIDYDELSSFSEYELLGNYYYNKYKNKVFFSDFKNIAVSEKCFFKKRLKMNIFSLYYKSCSMHQR